MDVEFRRLSEVDPGALVELMSSPSVRRHLPLASAPFDRSACARFVDAKEGIWAERGWGPWAFVADGRVLGWGGPQPEGSDVDIALVLGPAGWGLGGRLHAEIVRRVFADTGVESVTALLPTSRAGGVRRLGYVPDGHAEVGGHRFTRYRLARPDRPG